MDDVSTTVPATCAHIRSGGHHDHSDLFRGLSEQIERTGSHSRLESAHTNRDLTELVSREAAHIRVEQERLTRELLAQLKDNRELVIVEAQKTRDQHTATELSVLRAEVALLRSRLPNTP